MGTKEVVINANISVSGSIYCIVSFTFIWYNNNNQLLVSIYNFVTVLAIFALYVDPFFFHNAQRIKK